MGYYVFKINLGPNIIEKTKNIDDIDYLYAKLIPDAIETAYPLKKVGKGIYKLIDDTNHSEKFKKKYIKLEDLTKKLKHEYDNGIKRYLESGDSDHSANFIRLASKCGRLRSSLVKNYPVLKKTKELYEDDYIQKKYNIHTASQRRTGFTHLNQFFKIKEYLDENGLESVIDMDSEAYYNTQTEHLLIKSQQEKKAKSYAIEIANVLNRNDVFVKELGRLTILPIYEKFEIIGEITEIEYTIVYPNANSTSRDTTLERYHGNEEKITVRSDTTLNSNEVNKDVSGFSFKGYLKKWDVKFKNRRGIVQTVYKFIDDLTDDN